MSLWWQNDTHLHHMNNELSYQQQHTSLLYIQYCLLSFWLFIIQFHGRHKSAITKKLTVRVKAKIKQTVHNCRHRKTRLCAKGLMDPAVSWSLATQSHLGKISPCVPNPSLDWPYLNVSERDPVWHDGTGTPLRTYGSQQCGISPTMPPGREISHWPLQSKCFHEAGQIHPCPRISWTKSTNSVWLSP